MQPARRGESSVFEGHRWGTALLGSLASPGLLTAHSFPLLGFLSMAQNLEGQLSLLGREDPAPKSQAQAGTPHLNLMSPSESSTGCTSWVCQDPASTTSYGHHLGKVMRLLILQVWASPALCF